MEILSTYSNYRHFKQVLDAEMTRTAEGFVRIGYMLAYAAETNIINEGGYETVNDFAKAEYGIDATQVSRFVNIYRRFGVPGEPRLQYQYTNHGVAKLGIMLTLPDAVNEEISDAYSKSEITEMKKIIDEEKQISDIEVLCEEKDKLQQLLPEGFKQLVMQFVKDYPEEYVKIYDAVTLEDVKEIVAPNGESMHKVRIPGTGAYMIFAKADGNIVSTSIRTGEKNSYEWEQFFEVLKDYFVMGTDAKDSWSNVFKEPFPETEPVKEESENMVKSDKHNVQQVKQRKESKVKTPISKPKKEVEEEPEKEVEEQLPGQMAVTDFPEYLPESMKEDKPEVITGEVEDIIPESTEEPQKDNVQQECEGMQVEHFAPVQQTREEKIKECKVKFEGLIDELDFQFNNEEWGKAYAAATAIVWEIKKIQELEGKN